MSYTRQQKYGACQLALECCAVCASRVVCRRFAERIARVRWNVPALAVDADQFGAVVPEAARPAIGGQRAQQFVCPRVWRSLAREDDDGSAYVQLVQGAGAQQLGADLRECLQILLASSGLLGGQEI
ncbi:MAG: hypothetical protein QOJ89_5076 [bacterium]